MAPQTERAAILQRHEQIHREQARPAAFHATDEATALAVALAEADSPAAAKRHAEESARRDADAWLHEETLYRTAVRTRRPYLTPQERDAKIQEAGAHAAGLRESRARAWRRELRLYGG